MSTQKRRARKRNQRRKQSNRAPRKSAGRLPPPDEPVTVHVTEFDITDEPMPDPAERRLPREARDRLQTLDDRVHVGGPGRHLEEIQTMLAEYPQIARLHNYLCNAYEHLGRVTEAKQVARETLERFPRYVFAASNYVLYCLWDDEVEQAERVLDGRYTICHFAPGRRRFHVSEFACYEATVGMYYCHVGQYASALRSVEPLLDVAPEHPLVRRLLSKLVAAKHADQNALTQEQTLTLLAMLMAHAPDPTE